MNILTLRTLRRRLPPAQRRQTPRSPRSPRTPTRGLTLLELAMVMAVLVVLASLAVPGMTAHLRAERLHTAAQLLAADIADARHEAARRGQTLHIESHAAAGGTAAWCWSVATTPTCPCGTVEDATAQTCRLKTVPASDHPGVWLLQSEPVHLQPDGQASPVLAAVFAAGERQLQVQVSRFGRARVCDPAGRSHRVPKC